MQSLKLILASSLPPSNTAEELKKSNDLVDLLEERITTYFGRREPYQKPENIFYHSVTTPDMKHLYVGIDFFPDQYIIAVVENNRILLEAKIIKP